MAKVWKPKYWDAKNPPDAGSRVFVGKANGASSYETINAGETKRILQSNGQNNIFFGNVTVPVPIVFDIREWIGNDDGIYIVHNNRTYSYANTTVTNATTITFRTAARSDSGSGEYLYLYSLDVGTDYIKKQLSLVASITLTGAGTFDLGSYSINGNYVQLNPASALMPSSGLSNITTMIFNLK